MLKNRENEYKVIVVGDRNVGKTTLLFKFFDKNFKPNEQCYGLRVDYMTKCVNLDDTTIKLHLFDTS